MNSDKGEIIQIASKVLIISKGECTALEIAETINKANLTPRGISQREVTSKLSRARHNGSHKVFEKIGEKRPYTWRMK